MRLRLALPLLILLTRPVCASDEAEPAAVESPAKPRGSLTFYTENDKYFAGTDQAYTNGFKVSYLSGDLRSLRDPEVFAPGRWFAKSLGGLVPEGLAYKLGLSFGQNIYTPVDIETTAYQPDDRPYAAWLYGGVALHILRPDAFGGRAPRLDVFELNVGVVGPSAHGEEVQNGVHDIIDVAQAEGWDNQIHDELGVNLIYERKYRFSTVAPDDRDRWAADFIPHAGFSLGNVSTYANVGAELRAGWRMPADFGSNLIRPSGDSNPDGHRPRFGVFLFGAFDARAVARDITLDGNTFEDSPSIDKESFVADLYGGIGISTPYCQIRYAQAYRTKEFEGQDDGQVFGSISVTALF
ncbi:MAG: lipid A deacylase LpxR family protein [Burkholderiales bacterium]|nr:lipid A deacylase LpxR family protein [Opitutaceae bacterium]